MTFEADTVLDLLGDPVVREILVVAGRSPASVRTLETECGVAKSTIYRRVSEMVEAEMLVEHTHIDPDGNHHQVYETVIDRLELDVEADGLDLRNIDRGDPSDRVDELWDDVGED
ncbi:winged helix-turn-helix domain-containing protein [Halococcoides cellulosivorans]|uniref:Transcriptional regulator n=1 Tax=Halococcoides cellulosivorans TaxID=1679096 RepID=A0A2R4X2X8_9EURY|nr:helix-turn-helix domain-containing protein [Halococcoides cellulosivorans]AWB28150.1 transcriptional regulator [Halococcoides cellulosivorans]